MKTAKIVQFFILASFIFSSCSKDAEESLLTSGNEAALTANGDEVISKKGLPIDGKQEVPARNTKACGTIDVSYNKTTKWLLFTVKWQNLTGNPTGSHIHGEAPRGVNAGIKFDFTEPLPKTTSGTYSDSVRVDEVAIKEADLLNGRYYLNIHTPLYPAGEIRGQIEFKKSDIISRKKLPMDGTQEVPMRETEGCGSIDLVYDKTSKILTYTVYWKNLTGIPTGSHIHGEAPRGVNAPIKHDFTEPLPKTTSGSFTNSVVVDEVAIKEADLLKGLYYINIHTPTYPGGEIRGQLEFKKADIISKKGLVLNGDQEVPVKNTGATGTMDVTYNKAAKILSYTISWENLSGNPVGSHIHGLAPRGVNAPIVHDFTALIPKTTSGTLSGSVSVDEEAIKEDELLDGQYYLNIHTPLNPGGEIRGQIEFK